MNKTTPYEDLIAAKLDQIPVPDMSDSIWANIEMQLNEIPEAPETKPSGGNAGNAWYGVITLAVVTTLCCWFYTHKKPIPKQIIIPPIEIAVPPKDSPAIIKTIQKQLPVVENRDTIQAVITIPEELKPELPELADSTLTNPPVINPQVVEPAPPIKKHKGVKGISGDDYRLSVQRRDSINP
ncbi:hypothetical protein [Chitinophaga sancti]|uniref:hypothetical protein n=1 Tax=Chitinophaga sancti TaxID=1004 RepID=UPI003F792AFB